MKLVDAEDLKKNLGSGWVNYKFVMRHIDETPPVDAVKVVRCETCKYWEPEYGEDGGVYGKCTLWGGTCESEVTEHTWFCADGKEKE